MPGRRSRLKPFHSSPFLVDCDQRHGFASAPLDHAHHGFEFGSADDIVVKKQHTADSATFEIIDDLEEAGRFRIGAAEADDEHLPNHALQLLGFQVLRLVRAVHGTDKQTKNYGNKEDKRLFHRHNLSGASEPQRYQR